MFLSTGFPQTDILGSKDRKLLVKSNQYKNIRWMELELQLAYKISKKILESANH